MLDEDCVRLRHMVEAAESAVQFMAGRQRSDLDADRMLLFAVVRAIEILVEAASKISQETRATHKYLGVLLNQGLQEVSALVVVTGYTLESTAVTNR
jgi:uncharacterized protein with HEPN domain